MSKIEHLVLVGCGNMGFSLLQGWLAARIVPADNIHVIEPDADLRERARAQGVRIHATPDDVEGLAPDAIVLAVKPQIVREVAARFSRFSASATFISIAAGVSLDALETVLGPARIVRAMPNTPASIGKGATIIFPNAIGGTESRQLARALLSASGKVFEVDDEAAIDAATAISGSGPAYVFHFIECLAEAGTELGLPQRLAEALALETVYGAGALAAASPEKPATLRRQVTSPNGTTAAALDVLTAEEGLSRLINAAARAARDRALQLKA